MGSNLKNYLLSLQVEDIWMHFFADGCDRCPAKDFCWSQPEETCCRENFMEWAKEAENDG